MEVPMGDGPDYESMYEDTIERYANEGRDPSSAIQDAYDDDCYKAELLDSGSRGYRGCSPPAKSPACQKPVQVKPAVVEPEYIFRVCHNCGVNNKIRVETSYLRMLFGASEENALCGSCNQFVSGERASEEKRAIEHRRKERNKGLRILLGTFIGYALLIWAIGPFGFFVAFFTCWIPLIWASVYFW